MTGDETRPAWMTILGRVGASTLTVGVLVASVVAGALGVPQAVISSLPGGDEQLEVQQIQVSPPDRVVVCAGPMLGFIPQDAAARGFGRPTETIIGPEVASDVVESPELFTEVGLEGSDPASPVTIHRQPADQPGLAGVGTISSSTNVLQGFAVSSCVVPQFDTWIPAGSTVTGRQAVVSLANPGQVPASVDITVYGAGGIISSPSTQGILLAPGTRRVFPLSGFAPDEASPVLRIQSSGSPVAATLHTTITRGLSADGMAIATGVSEVGTRAVIPAVLVEGDDQALEARQQEGYADLAPALRLLAPDSNTVAQIRIIRPGQSDVVSEARLTAGRVTDVNLDLLGSGVFSIIVEADQPVVAGARVSVVGEGVTDVSWVAAQPVLTAPTVMALPFGPETTISVVSPDEDVTVTISRLSSDGSSVVGRSELRVSGSDAANRLIGVAGGGYLIEATGPVIIAAVVTLDAGVGHVTPSPTSPEVPPVSVIVR
jgi:hypothetical protein